MIWALTGYAATAAVWLAYLFAIRPGRGQR